MKKHDIYKNAEKNLVKCFEMTGLIIEMRKAVLKGKYPDLSDGELTRRVTHELVVQKEKKWNRTIS